MTMSLQLGGAGEARTHLVPTTHDGSTIPTLQVVQEPV